MDSATETVCRRKPALAAKVEAALTEPTEAEEEDAPAQEADLEAGCLVLIKLRLTTCEVAKGNYLTFLGEERDLQRPLHQPDKYNDKKQRPPGKVDWTAFQGECRKCGQRGHKASSCEDKPVAQVRPSLTVKRDKPCP